MGGGSVARWWPMGEEAWLGGGQWGRGVAGWWRSGLSGDGGEGDGGGRGSGEMLQWLGFEDMASVSNVSNALAWKTFGRRALGAKLSPRKTSFTPVQYWELLEQYILCLISYMLKFGFLGKILLNSKYFRKFNKKFPKFRMFVR
jgi:hypothetical protein